MRSISVRSSESGKTRDGTTVALAVVLGNLLRTHQLDPQRYLAVLLSSNDYRKGQHNPYGIGYRQVRRVVEFLENSDPPLIELRKGAHFKDHGFPTKLRMTKALAELLEPLSLEAINQLTQRRTNNTSPGVDPQSTAFQALFLKENDPLLRLKNERKKIVEFEPTAETDSMQERLVRFNDFIELQWIDLLLPDYEFQEIVNGAYEKSVEPDEFGETPDPNMRRVDLVFQRRLYRVFNNGTFEEGGRFYGGWWQNIPRRYRKFITINWAPIIELDFSNMQAAMLYAKEGLAIEEDAYSIDGIDRQYRPLIKRTFFKLINAEGRVKAPRRTALPDGWTWAQLQEAIRDKHAPIADYFNTGIGIQLQRIDADIAEEVVMTMMERDILVLPVHDSFLAYPAQKDALKDVMATAYRNHMKSEIGIEADPSFIDEELAEVKALEEEGVYFIQDAIDDIERKPEYANYRNRKLDFLADKDEQWRYRFYPHGSY